MTQLSIRTMIHHIDQFLILPSKRATDLYLRNVIINFGSIFTAFDLSIIFGGSWKNIGNWLDPEIEPPSDILVCQNQ